MLTELSSFKFIITTFLLVSIGNVAFAQNPSSKVKFWNPQQSDVSYIEGQGWLGEMVGNYNRLPLKMKGVVGERLWQLSQNSAGLKIRFKTNAQEIIVRYVVNQEFDMPHMPATGVSGLDLYAKTAKGEWLWAAGKFHFNDTITYKFQHILTKEYDSKELEYQLYLPLYNTVSWMEIGVQESAFFQPLTPRQHFPIVIYGTSIAQGACASRPGLAWTNILERKLGMPVLNLGFSGNGKLEKPLLNLMSEIDASLYVLDCLPNLTKIPKDELEELIYNAVVSLKKQHPETAVLLTAHGGYTEENLSDIRKLEYENANKALDAAFKRLKKNKINQIYMLSKNELGQGIETMVDGIHPNDLGMMLYAEGYFQKSIKF